MSKMVYSDTYKEIFNALIENILYAGDSVQAEDALDTMRYELISAMFEERCWVGEEFMRRLKIVDTAKDNEWRVRYIESLRAAMSSVGHLEYALDMLHLYDGEFVMVTVDDIVNAPDRSVAERYLQVMLTVWYRMDIEVRREYRNDYLVTLYLKLQDELKERAEPLDRGIGQLLGYIMEVICSPTFPYDRIEDIPTGCQAQDKEIVLGLKELCLIRDGILAVDGAAAVDDGAAAKRNWQEYKRILRELPVCEELLGDYVFFLMNCEIAQRLQKMHAGILDEHMAELVDLSTGLSFSIFYFTADRTIFSNLLEIAEKAMAGSADSEN